jgi:ARG/rhodanese/phosphatase superfamily protein
LSTTTLPFQVGDPVEHRGIVVAPLFPLRDPVARYVTLDTALARGLSITETSEAGDVPELAVRNTLQDDVLLYDGAEVVGAKQNRILNVSVLVPAGSTLRIPVSCTEEGRWRSVSTSFSPARHIANSELRRRKAMALAAAPLARGAAQRHVWDSVRAQAERMGSVSPTGAHRDLFLARERELAALEPAFAAEPGQCGAVLGLGETLCLDAVSRPDAFAVIWPKLRRGYLLDALERLDGRPTRSERLLGFVDEVADAPVRRGPSVGLGTDVRLQGPGVLGSGLAIDEETIQLSAFTALEGDDHGAGRSAWPSHGTAGAG